LRNAITQAADLLRLQRSGEARLAARQAQLGLLRHRRDLADVRAQLYTECEDLHRILLANGRALVAALRRVQALADAQPEPVDIDAMVMAEVQRLTRARWERGG
jgi:hypothetical protein